MILSCGKGKILQQKIMPRRRSVVGAEVEMNYGRESHKL